MTAPHFDGSQPCAQTDPDAFFPDKGGPITAAKRVCRSCEFIDPCLEYALEARDSYGNPIKGIWAATSALERRHINAKRQGNAA